MPKIAKISDFAPTPRKEVEAILSSAACVALMKFSASISEAKFGAKTISHFQHGMTLNDDWRKVCECIVEQIESKAYPALSVVERRNKFAPISKMLLVSPTADRSEESTIAKVSAYLDDALNDLPAWAVDEAVRRWHRGECGDEHNYRFAPTPGVLRKIALKELEPAVATLRRLRLVLSAAPSYADAEKLAAASFGAVVLRPMGK